MPKTKKTAAGRPGLAAALAANFIAVLPLVWAATLNAVDKEAYYLAAQEDEFLEWATVWAFAIAAVCFVVAAIRQWRAEGKAPWFLAGVALFCVFVAGEEISWGQRVLGYRPPVYFLEQNFQQELNVHNVISTSLRKLGLKSVLLGYGVLLPLAALAPPVRRFLDRVAIVAPPASLAPAFLVAAALYEWYPYKFTGEIVELMLGLLLLIAAFAAADAFAGAMGNRPYFVRLAAALALLALLGAGATAYSRGQRGSSEEMLAAAQAETDALRADFLEMALRNRGRTVTRCGTHKRLFSFVEKYDTEYLLEGSFAALTQQGLPEVRADYFIDPWNTPYWIRDECSRRQGRRKIFVYSFGPDRKRDSTEWELRGDDIGSLIFEL